MVIKIIIDAHGHIGHFNNKWWGIEKLKDFCSSKVDKIFISNLSIIAHGMKYSTNELIKLINNDKTNFLYGLIWCDPFYSNWRSLILKAKTELKDRFIGIKIHPTIGNYNANDECILDPIFEFSESNQIPIFTHCDDERSAAWRFLPLLEDYPLTYLVFYHGKHKKLDNLLERKNKFPNIFIESSFCHSNRIREIIDNFGSKCIIFGTDAPFRHRSPYDIILKVYREVLNEKEQQLFFFENAMRLVNINK